MFNPIHLRFSSNFRDTFPLSLETDLLNMAACLSYPVGVAKLSLRQPIFDDNRKAWGQVLERFNNALEQVCSEGTSASQQRHQSRGQLLGMASSPSPTQ